MINESTEEGPSVMNFCVHIDPAGRRCTAPAILGSNFCSHHDPESLEPPAFRLWVFRVAAAMLLAFILLELYLYVRSALP